MFNSEKCLKGIQLEYVEKAATFIPKLDSFDESVEVLGRYTPMVVKSKEEREKQEEIDTFIEILQEKPVKALKEAEKTGDYEAYDIIENLERLWDDIAISRHN